MHEHATLRLLICFCLALAWAAPTMAEDKDKPNETKVELKVGETHTLRLNANATTGYLWYVDVKGDAAVVQSSKFIAPDSDRDGAPGKHEFVFEAKKAGEALVTLRYARGKKGKPAEIITLRIMVTK